MGAGEKGRKGERENVIRDVSTRSLARLQIKWGSTIVKMNVSDLPPGEVHLYWASLDLSDTQIEVLRRTLVPAELRRAERFRVARAARRFIAARAALRIVLAGSTGVAPVNLKFRFGKHGKPYLADGGPFFNASDSGDVVVIALTTAEVGVDIELLRPLARGRRLARRICTERELELFQATPEDERDALLLRLWTCKEAALKAIGTGLPGGVRNVETALPTGGSPRLARLLDETEEWTLLFPDLLPNLLCSVVVRGSCWREVIRPFSLQLT
jgi:4'-phosphopantetheinyl transferase